MVRDQTKVPAGYLWKKTDRNGEEYLSGVISLGIFGEIPIVVFREGKKDNSDKGPDFVIRNATENRSERQG